MGCFVGIVKVPDGIAILAPRARRFLFAIALKLKSGTAIGELVSLAIEDFLILGLSIRRERITGFFV